MFTINKNVDQILAKFSSIVDELKEVQGRLTIQVENKQTDVIRLKAEIEQHKAEADRAAKAQAKIEQLLG